MDISPNDIRNYEFSNQMRGYDKDEVDTFLNQIAEVLEEAKQEKMKLSMELESVRSQLSGLKQFEDTIKSAAIDARRNADMTITTAKQEAEMIMSKAKQEADRLVTEKAQNVNEIEGQITKLSLTKKSYLSKIRNLINSHLEMVEEIAEMKELDSEVRELVAENGIDVTESTDVTTDSREGLDTEPSEETIHTEEANAASEEVIATEVDEPQTTEVTEDLKAAIKDEEEAVVEEPAEVEPEPKEIDPELAAALASYKQTAAQASIDPVEAQAAAAIESAPPQGEVVETEARAEDIPDGFIAMNGQPIGEDTDRVPTDKVQTASVDANVSSEPNSLDIDSPEKEEPISAEQLVDELDEVAAKFEQEMDKAQQS